MYTVVAGIDVTRERFEELRPVLTDIEETDRLKLKLGILKINDVNGGCLHLNVSYCGLDKK